MESVLMKYFRSYRFIVISREIVYCYCYSHTSEYIRRYYKRENTHVGEV